LNIRQNCLDDSMASSATATYCIKGGYSEVEKEEVEVSVVPEADAVPDPGTVVVHLHDTSTSPKCASVRLNDKCSRKAYLLFTNGAMVG